MARAQQAGAIKTNELENMVKTMQTVSGLKRFTHHTLIKLSLSISLAGVEDFIVHHRCSSPRRRRDSSKAQPLTNLLTQ